MVGTHETSLSELLRDLKAAQPDPPEPAPSTPVEETKEASVVHLVDVPTTVTAKNVFRHPESHPLVLDLLMIDKYGMDWLGWEAETIERNIPGDFGVDRISDLNLSKLQAMRTLHLVDSFWERWEVFVWCAMPLNAVFPDFQVMQVPTVLQCMVAADIAKRVRSDTQWSHELLSYLAVVHRHDGILVPQSPLGFVEVDTAGLPLDVGNVIERWQAVRQTGKAPTEETPEAEQLRRMLILRNSLEEKRAVLRKQLEVVHHV